MNLRALMLLASFLLSQAGNGVLQTRVAGQTDRHAKTCGMSCCAALAADEESCGCAAAPASPPESPLPLPLESARDRTPQPVLTLMTNLTAPVFSGHEMRHAGFHPVALRPNAARAVGLPVLFCSILI